MPTITNQDGIEIFYKDWGSGQPIVFSHGWPLSADDWDAQLLFFLHRGYRVIAHDRRGHGRSTQTAEGHDMDHYADDLAALTAHLDLKNAIHVGHSTGGGEVTRYLGRHGESRGPSFRGTSPSSLARYCDCFEKFRVVEEWIPACEAVIQSAYIAPSLQITPSRRRPGPIVQPAWSCPMGHDRRSDQTQVLAEAWVPACAGMARKAIAES